MADEWDTNHVRMKDLPKGVRLIGGSDVFVRKWISLQEFDKHKMRHVAWGHLMIPGDDYGDTASPTASPVAIRLFFSIVAAERITPCAIDVKTAFLNCLQTRRLLMRRPHYASILVKEESKTNPETINCRQANCESLFSMAT